MDSLLWVSAGSLILNNFINVNRSYTHISERINSLGLVAACLFTCQQIEYCRQGSQWGGLGTTAILQNTQGGTDRPTYTHRRHGVWRKRLAAPHVNPWFHILLAEQLQAGYLTSLSLYSLHYDRGLGPHTSG